ncbi:MAG TPA: SRPBCC family protein [Bryobacteraceae bacterium]|nr:SRPBCC family protein [Bryobacteraceae bacterium]
MSELNQIQRSTLVRAPRSRVWRALTDIADFCRWFSAETEEAAFTPGAHIRFRSTYPGPHYQKPFSLTIEEMTAAEKFSWRWHPGAKLPGEDVSNEPMTLVTFTLQDADGGTQVTVTETGFDLLFAARRERAFKDNDGGWKTQMAALERYFREGA